MSVNVAAGNIGNYIAYIKTKRKSCASLWNDSPTFRRFLIIILLQKKPQLCRVFLGHYPRRLVIKYTLEPLLSKNHGFSVKYWCKNLCFSRNRYDKVLSLMLVCSYLSCDMRAPNWQHGCWIWSPRNFKIIAFLDHGRRTHPVCLYMKIQWTS